MTTHGQRIKDLAINQAAVLEKIPGGGSLEARALRSGVVQLYWRFTQDKKTERVPIGAYDPSAPPKSLKPTNRGYSIQAALDAARELAKRNREADGGLRGERQREAAAKAAEVAELDAKSKYTVKALCTDYWTLLKDRGKQSHADARNVLENHLIDAFPEVATLPAAKLEKRQVVLALRRLTEADKSNTARKLRAYLRAAYACALKADSDATLPSSFIAYNVTSNPVEGTAAIRGTADKNPLTLAGLQAYWKALQHQAGPVGAALRLHVLTGGQRAAQLARLRAEDITSTTFKLFDPKGKRHEPRPHVLPLTKQIQAELVTLPATGFKLSTDGGKTPMHVSSLSAWAASVGKAAKIEGFQLKRVRSGIETALAAARVPREVRGQLQSHGIGGVQERHYDDHHYLPEKLDALKVLYRLLEGKEVRVPANRRRSASK